MPRSNLQLATDIGRRAAKNARDAATLADRLEDAQPGPSPQTGGGGPCAPADLEDNELWARIFLLVAEAYARCRVPKTETGGGGSCAPEDNDED